MTGSLATGSTDSFLIHPDDVVYVVVDDPALTVEVATGEPVAVVMVAGPAGPPGMPGAAGERGPVGATGAAGATGPAGEIVEPTFHTAVLPAGDGVTVSFPLPVVARFPSQILVSRNGLFEVPGVGFTATASDVTFSNPPLDSDVVAVFYQV